MSAGSYSNQSPLRILCVDDQRDIVTMLRRVLQRDGYIVEGAVDGQEALEAVLANPHPFDVLITDHKMPRLSGLALVARLREIDFSGEIIVHTAGLAHAEMDAYRALAVTHFIDKPCNFGMLQALIESIARANH